MRYYCKYHEKEELVKSKENPSGDVFICRLCKHNKQNGRDGIYHISELRKEESVLNTNGDSNIWFPIGDALTVGRKFGYKTTQVSQNKEDIFGDDNEKK